MKARMELWLSALALALCTSCPLLGSKEESFEGTPAASEDRIPVVDDVGPFDPSEAVDDDDGSVVLADTDDPTDRGAFSEKEGGGKKPPSTEGAENEKADDMPSKPGGPGESVTTPAEVEAREEQRERQVEQVDQSAGDEDEQKVALGHNPPPEPTKDPEGVGNKALDLTLETLVVALCAALLSAGIVFARSHVKAVSIATIVIVVLAWFVSTQIA